VENMDIVRKLVREALDGYVGGKNKEAKLDEATTEVVGAISHLISLNESKPKRMGATILTEAASLSKTLKPRTI
jgi:hypothetical protein